MSYKVIPTGRFQKDLKRAEKRGLKLNLLADAIKILASGEPLPPKYKDHPLTGNYEGCRECHIQPDWLLIYETNEKDAVLAAMRTGTHSDLF